MTEIGEIARSYDDIIGDIDRRLQEEQKTLEALEEQFKVARERVQRLAAAKRSLEGTQQAGRPRRRGRPLSNPNWKPSAESIQAILVTLSEAPAPLTIKEIEEATGRSHSHVDESIRYLRQHEMVRLAGKKGPANTYATMPNESGPIKETEHAAHAA